MVDMRVILPLLRIPSARAPILRYGVAVLSTALALIPTILLADVSESRLALFGVAVMVSAWYGGWKPGVVATAFALTVVPTSRSPESTARSNSARPSSASRCSFSSRC